MASNNSSGSTSGGSGKKEKKLFITEKVNLLWDELRLLTKADRLQYRTDIKAVMCRGIPDNEAYKIKQGLQIENGFFGLSRAYVPFTIWRLYRRGVFQETFSFGELKYMFRIMVFMHLIDCFGHLVMKQYTKELYNKHIGVNEDTNAANNKKAMDDYII